MKIDSSKPNHFSRSTTAADNTQQQSSQVDQDHFEKQLKKQSKSASQKKDDKTKQPDTLSSLPNPFMLAASLKQPESAINNQAVQEVSKQLTELVTEYRRQLSNQTTLQITLKHPLLNNTQLTLSLTNNQLQVAFAASEKQQYDLLSQATAQLKNQLAQRFGQVSVELGLSIDPSYQQQTTKPDYIAEQENQE
ncbi:type III secretion HpaP family protein [Spartinivicinus ruber]|uniref:type III secretion HpaP family protein n=1 Tax=Spartinivicinus ruber TaxID=2683272 RepID=UPI0013D436F3|nr:type III secretion HpaP family protein [Spartinivicinus ruber]